MMATSTVRPTGLGGALHANRSRRSLTEALPGRSIRRSGLLPLIERLHEVGCERDTAGLPHVINGLSRVANPTGGIGR